MATRTTIYEQLLTRHYSLSHPTRSDSKAVRWLVQFLPAEDAPLLETEATYEPLPSDTVLDQSVGDCSFSNGVFVGLPLSEERELKIDYLKLPEDLRQWLTVDSGVSIIVDEERYWISCVVLLYSDRGDATLDVDEFHLEFIGGHVRQEHALYTLGSAGGPVTISLTLQHLGKLCLEAVDIDWLRTYVIDTYAGSMTAHQYLFQTLYDNQLVLGGQNARYGWAELGITNDERAWLLPWYDLLDSIAALMQMVFHRYMRTTGAGPNWAGAVAGWYSSRPFTRSWTLFRQLYDSSRLAGTALTWGTGLESKEVKFVALISDVPTPVDTSSAGTNWIGGLLGGTVAGRGDDTLFAYDNAYQLVKGLAEGSAEKHLLRCDYVPAFNLYALSVEAVRLTAPGDSADIPAYPVGTVTPADFVKDSLTWEPRKDDLRGAEYDVPGAIGVDIETVKVSVPQQPGGMFSATAVVHNLPSLGRHEWLTSGLFTEGIQPTNNAQPIVTPNIIAIANPRGYNSRVLYYEDNPTGVSTTTIAIRVHSGCDYHYGDGGDLAVDQNNIGLTTNYPTQIYFGVYNGTTKASYDRLTFAHMFALLIEEQRLTNILRAMARGIVKIFTRNSAPLQTGDNPYGTATLKGTLIGHFPASIAGRELILDDSDDGFTLEGTRTTLWDRDPSQRRLIITVCRPDDVAGTAEIEATATHDDVFYTAP